MKFSKLFYFVLFGLTFVSITKSYGDSARKNNPLSCHPATLSEPPKAAIDQHPEDFAQLWDELLSSRREMEDHFFVRLLEQFFPTKNVRIIDAATGTGFHTIDLMKSGFPHIVSADLSPAMLDQTRANLQKSNFSSQGVVQANWLSLKADLKNASQHEPADVIFVLGNSFSYLFHNRDRQKALEEFHKMLKPGGLLIIDQRNYDEILRKQGIPSHWEPFYYGGQDGVSAKPIEISAGMAHFEYTFSPEIVRSSGISATGTEAHGAVVQHLKMFPLNREYMKWLFEISGFDLVEEFGDFNEEFDPRDVAFFQYVLRKPKEFQGGPMNMKIQPSDATHTQTTADYYDSPDANIFYETIWGGDSDHIHIGLYGGQSPENADISEAAIRTIETMLSQISPLEASDNPAVLDLGSGFGGTLRQIAKKYKNVRGIGVNLSAKENEIARRENEDQKLDDRIEIYDGTFENLSQIPSGSIDVVWSQDAFLHSSNRAAIWAEIERVLKPGGEVVFTDILQSPHADPDQMKPIYERIGLSSLATVQFYEQMAAHFGLSFDGFDNQTSNLVTHYSAVRATLINQEQALIEAGVSIDYIEAQKNGLLHWIEAGGDGRLEWGIIRMSKPERSTTN